MPPGIQIRSWTSDDHNAVYAHWLDSYRDQVYEIPRNVYKKLYGGLVLDRLLNRPPAKVAIACFANRPTQIAGFVAYEVIDDRPYVHYIYVKKIFRKHGIGTALLEHATHGEPYYYTFRPKQHAKRFFHGGKPSYRTIQKELPE